LLIDVSELVHQVLSWDSHLVEFQSSVVDTVKSHLVSHIHDFHSWHFIHVIISDPHQNGSDTFVLALYNGLTEHKSIVCMLEPISDPVLLTQHSRGVDLEFLGLFIVGNCGLHLDGVVTVTKLGEAEAANDFSAINLGEVFLVSLGMKSCHGASE
jgi:hypothetical protein